MKKLLLLLMLPLSLFGQSALSDGAVIRRTIKDMPYFYHYGVIYGKKTITEKDGTKSIELMVAHFSVDGFKYTTLSEFSEGLPVQVRYKGKTGEDLKKFKERYKTVIEKYKKSSYDGITNNCEHFATELVFGVKKSFQSEYVVDAAKVYWANVKNDIITKYPTYVGYVGVVDNYLNNLEKPKN